MIIEPNEALFNSLCSSIEYLPSNDGGDQVFLNSFHKDWPSSKYLHLDHKYNVPAGNIDEYCRLHGYKFLYERMVLDTTISIIHYWGGYKPWEITVKLLKRRSNIKWEQSLILWWDVFLEAAADIYKYAETFHISDNQFKKN